MLSNRGGYTVIEVLLVLAITGALLTVGFSAFRGKQGQVQFQQAMYNTQSEFQTIVNDVLSGATQDGTEGGDASSAICEETGSGTPGVRPPDPGETVSGVGTGQDCLMLGRSVLVTPDSGTLNIFVVVGLRYLAGSDRPVTNFEEAAPTPVNFTHNNWPADFTKRYALPGGTQVISAKVVGQTGEFDLVGFYLNPQAGSSAGQGSTFTALAYPFPSTSDNYKVPLYNNSIERCIQQNSPCTNPVPLGVWELCLQNSTTSSERAKLIITGKPGGVITDLKFENCT